MFANKRVIPWTCFSSPKSLAFSIFSMSHSYFNFQIKRCNGHNNNINKCLFDVGSIRSSRVSGLIRQWHVGRIQPPHRSAAISRFAQSHRERIRLQGAAVSSPYHVLGRLLAISAADHIAAAARRLHQDDRFGRTLPTTGHGQWGHARRLSDQASGATSSAVYVRRLGELRIDESRVSRSHLYDGVATAFMRDHLRGHWNLFGEATGITLLNLFIYYIGLLAM